MAEGLSRVGASYTLSDGFHGSLSTHTCRGCCRGGAKARQGDPVRMQSNAESFRLMSPSAHPCLHWQSRASHGMLGLVRGVSAAGPSPFENPRGRGPRNTGEPSKPESSVCGCSVGVGESGAVPCLAWSRDWLQTRPQVRHVDFCMYVPGKLRLRSSTYRPRQSIMPSRRARVSFRSALDQVNRVRPRAPSLWASSPQYRVVTRAGSPARPCSL